jgi:hypothetical protein
MGRRIVLPIRRSKFMPENPNDPTPQDIEEELNRRRFEADAVSRQSNVLPLDAARNEGQFYGQLIRGERSPNVVQRIGFFLVGILFCSQATFVFVGAFPRLSSVTGLHLAPIGGESVSIAYLPIAAIVLFLGLKIIGTAIRPSK